MAIELLGVVDAARAAEVTRPTIRKWIDEGLDGRCLAAVVYGGDLFIDPRELDLFLGHRARLFSEANDDDVGEEYDEEYDDEEYDDE